jgi:hypothetical protein
MDILSGYEKIHSIIGCVVASIVGIIMIGISIHLIMTPVRKASVEGKVTTYNPQTKATTVSYKVGNNTYFLNSSGNSAVGNSVLVLYETNNPSNARLSTQISNKKLALILLGMAIVIMALTYLSTYFVFKSKTYAAVAGGLDIASDVAGIIRN